MVNGPRGIAFEMPAAKSRRRESGRGRLTSRVICGAGAGIQAKASVSASSQGGSGPGGSPGPRSASSETSTHPGRCDERVWGMLEPDDAFLARAKLEVVHDHGRSRATLSQAGVLLRRPAEFLEPRRIHA